MPSEIKSPQTPVRSKVPSPALAKSGRLGVVPEIGVPEQGETKGLTHEWTDSGRTDDGLVIGSFGDSNGVGNGISDTPPESVSSGGRSMVAVPGDDDSGEWGTCGLLSPVLVGEDGGRTVVLGSSFGGEVSSMISIAMVVGSFVSPNWGVAVGGKETVPCKDRFLFSSSPRRSEG